MRGDILKTIFKYIRPYFKECVLSPLFKLFEALFELFVPLVIAAVIDSGIYGKDSSYVIKMCLVLVLLGAAGLAFSVTAQFFAAKASVGLSRNLRQALFSHIQKFSYKDIDKVGTPTMINRITSDVNLIQNGVNLGLRLLLRSPFIVFGSVIMAFTIDFKSALVFVGVVPPLFIVVYAIMFVTVPLYKKVQNLLDHILLKTRENLIGTRVIRSFCTEKDEAAKLISSNEENSSLQQYVGKISSLLNPLTFAIINVAVIILIYVGGLRVNSGSISQGGVVALYNYMSQILVELIKLANLIVTIAKAISSSGRVQEVLDIEPSLKDGKAKITLNENTPVAEFKNVSFSYNDGGQSALSDISFSVNKGETVGIIGGTGSGKTTLVNLLPRFYDASEGCINIFGTDVREYPKEQLRELFGIVPQKSVLFHGSIRENIRWGKNDATDEEIFDALKLAQAESVVKSKKGGLDYIVEQGGSNFSGGQKQRLAIARALVRNPRILILDDSSSALDFATDSALRKAVKTLKFGATFIVSQRVSSVMHADKIIVLHDGNSVGIGTHETLLSSCEIYKEIYDSQLGKEDDNEQ